jgi:RHS repeat-associated protein
LLLHACCLGRLPLGIETSFADGSSKSWRFLRGPDVSGTLEGAGGARGVLEVLKDASSWKAVAADTLGNVLALAGTNGDFTRRTFDPWGNPLVRDTLGSLRAATLNERRADYDALPLAWASQEVDSDTGLTHYHFREYSPSLGGWLTRDPIGLAGGYLNLRSYLGNRPADHLDQWGEFWGAVIGAGVDFFVQTVVEGKSLRKVSYYRVAASAAIGLATGGASALVSRGASAAGASLAGRVAGQAMVGATASVTQNSVVNIANNRPLEENAGKAAIAGALIAGAMEPLMEGAGAITDVVTEAYSETRIGVSLIRGSSKSGGANAVAAEVSVAENATAQAAAQAEASASVQVRLPCPDFAKSVGTPYGRALQSDTAAALAAREQVYGGATLYRVGTIGKSAAGEAQFWALERPSSPGFALRYGMPAENIAAADFIETATLRPGTPFVTRPAPGIGTNPGGGIEVVVPSSGVRLESFHYSPNILGQ